MWIQNGELRKLQYTYSRAWNHIWWWKEWKIWWWNQVAVIAVLHHQQHRHSMDLKVLTCIWFVESWEYHPWRIYTPWNDHLRPPLSTSEDDSSLGEPSESTMIVVPVSSSMSIVPTTTSISLVNFGSSTNPIMNTQEGNGQPDDQWHDHRKRYNHLHGLFQFCLRFQSSSTGLTTFDLITSSYSLLITLIDWLINYINWLIN